MLRVTRFVTDQETQAVRVEGRLTRADLPRLQEACGEIAAGAALSLDLSGLQFADPAAAAALRAMRSRGVSLVGASGFLEALLAEPSR